MTNGRYGRWQAASMAQLTVVVALISSLSVTSLGAGLSLLQNKEFMALVSRGLFVTSLISIFIAMFLICIAVVTRLLDFRLTARQIRKLQKPDYSKSLTIFCLNSKTYGKITWTLFWFVFSFFLSGILMFGVSIAGVYFHCLH